MDRFPYKIIINDNGWMESTPTRLIRHMGDAQKWVRDELGMENLCKTWQIQSADFKQDFLIEFRFRREKDFVLFCLKFGDRSVTGS